MTVLITARLRLEPFEDGHLDGLNAMNADPEVMRYLTGRPETREETLAAIERVKARWAEWGFSWWSFIAKESDEIVGAGPLEIGWRVRRDKWRQGLAFEAAERMVTFAFETLEANLLCAVCHPENIASVAVMKKLGMRFRSVEEWYSANDLTFEITRNEWRMRAGSSARVAQ